MFSFFRKKKEPQKGPQLKVDLHSHIIPGIDDGSQNIQDSLVLLLELEKLGYEKIITTPHIMADTYPNTAAVIFDGLKRLREAAIQEGISMTIEAAAEYYLDEFFFDEMQKKEILSIADEYVLFESSYISKPFQMEEMIFAIGEAGYRPMMAHPERYRYVKEWEKEYGRWKSLGVLFQVNLNSFGGHYGKDAKEKALFLSRSGMIDFLGSDVHHKKQTETLHDLFLTDVYNEIFEKNHILNQTLL
jgi:tyrosine-protein phosphatase YwqE